MPSLLESARCEIRDPEFISVDAKVIRDESLACSAKTVYSVICANTDADTRSASLKVSDIAKEAGCSR
jgi:hypothetical protein